MRITSSQLQRIIREVFAATAEEEAHKVNKEAGISLVTDQAFWEEMGISTGEELAKSLLSSTYSDYYKEIHGIRPRWNMERIQAMTVEEIQAELDKLDDEAAELAKDPPHEWMEDRHREDQEDWEDEMMAAVEANPEDVPEEYLAYETLPQQTGMGRRTEGIMKITYSQLRGIIREALMMEDKSGKGACPKSGCVKKSGDKWRIISNKTGKMWPQHYDLKKDAEDALAAYHVSR